MKIKIVLTGRSYDQGSDIPEQMELEEGANLSAVITSLNGLLATPLPASCLIAVGGNHVGTVAQHTDSPLSEGQEIVFIQPVAGG